MKVIVFDTETTNTIDDPIMYDLGFAVVDTETHETLKTESLAIKEVFCDKELMEIAYFAEKIPQYLEEIENGDRKLVTLAQAYWLLRKTCKEYGVEKMFAHNARFDYIATATTQRYLTCSKYRYFLPYGIELCDTLKMARATFKENEDYIAFCQKNNYLTKNGGLRFTAEILYRFLTNNTEFVEEHKGLDDVLIEKEILFACLERGCDMLPLWD